MSYIDELGKNAKIASQSLVNLERQKNVVLGQVAEALLAETDFILQENARDVEKQEKMAFPPSWLTV